MNREYSGPAPAGTAAASRANGGNAEGRVMISIRGLTKEYRIGQIGYGTLNKDLQSWWAKVRGKQDPNVRIGQEKRLTGGRLSALRDIDLDVRQGECVGIIGGNGAGKSTLLKLISRVSAPTRGTIDLYGRVTSMLEVGTGFHGEMTGRENIYLNGAILGMNRREIDSKLEEIIAFSEVRDFIDTPVKRYSSGMYVKLAFSVASHLDSEIVIMDEVLAVGDAAFQKKCIAKMRNAAKDEARTVLYVSHNMETVRELCDRCIVLSEGQIVYDGDVEQAITYYHKYLRLANDPGIKVGAIARRDRDLTGICRMTDLHVENQAARSDDTLRFALNVESTEARDDLCLRMTVCSGPGSIVGMAASKAFRVNAGDNHCRFAFPVFPLEAGSYLCDLTLFSYDGTTQTRHDNLRKVLEFQVESAQLYSGKQWTQRNWGSVRLSEIRIEGMDDGNQA